MLKQILQKYVDQQVKVIVFNSKSKTIRGVLKILLSHVSLQINYFIFLSTFAHTML